MEPATTQPIPEPDPRVLFAAERTLLAWVRTALALMGLGFVVARFGLFLHELATIRNREPVVETGGSTLSLWVGVGLVALGMVMLIGAGSRYRRYVACLMAGTNPPAPSSAFGLILTGVLVAGGAGLIAYLLGVR